MSIFRRIAAILVGLVFLLSGLLKIMDPVGTGLIVTEYFRLVGIHIGLGFAKTLGVILSLTELTLAAALITGVWRKIVALATFCLTGFFTLVTLILLIFNPNIDCGCFGEAIHLTHLQSFLKNLILLLLAGVNLFAGDDFGEPQPKKYAAFALAEAGFIFAAVVCLSGLPPIDFTDFAPGNELFASENGTYPLEDGTFVGHIYEKNGQRGTFSEEHLPDTTWTFVAIDTLLRSSIPTHAATPILSFSDSEGDYCDSLAVRGKVLVISVYDAPRADAAGIADLATRATAAGIRPLVLTSGVPTDLCEKIGSDLIDEVYFCDYKTLITLNRRNGGATYIADGEIVRKFASPSEASPKYLRRAAKNNPMDTTIKAVSKPRIHAQAFLIYILAIFIFL